MESDLKKALILLKALIFHYHGMDHDEQKLLIGFVDEIEGKDEYDWAIKFISSDYMSAYDRAKEYFKKTIILRPPEERLHFLLDTWEDNHKKGYVTEMETTALINLSKHFAVEKEFLANINSI